MPLTPRESDDGDTSCGSAESFEADERVLYREKLAVFKKLFATSYEPMLTRESVFNEQHQPIIRSIKAILNDGEINWMDIVIAASELGRETDLYKAAQAVLEASIELDTLTLRPPAKRFPRFASASSSS